MKRLILISILFNISCVFGQINWEKIEGPDGAYIRKIIKGFDNDVAVIASNIYYSSNLGISWDKVEVDEFIPNDLLFSEGKVFAIGQIQDQSSGLVYISYDTMKTWNLENSGIENQNIRKFCYLKSTYFACTDSGVYEYSVQEKIWSRKYYITQLQYNMIFDMFYSSKNTVFLTTVAGLYRSKDNGVTWELMNAENTKMVSNLENYVIDENDRIYVNTPMGLFKSTDDGDTWTTLGQGIIESNLGFILKFGSDTLIVGKMWGGIYLSADDGGTWKNISNDSFTDLMVTNDGKYIVPTRDGVQVSDRIDGGWELRNKGIAEMSVSSLFLDKNNSASKDLILAGSDYGSIYKSTDRGVTWKKVFKFQGSSITSIIKKGNLLFASSVWGGIAKSSDLGETWTLANTGLGDPDVKTLAVDNNGNLYAGTFSEIFKSTNNGDSWISCLSQQTSIQCSKIVVNNDNQIFCGTLAYGALTSADGGVTWRQVVNGMQVPVASLELNPEGSLFATGTSGDLYSSTNNGQNWRRICSGICLTTFHFLSNTDLLGGIDQDHHLIGMFRSTDKGVTWFPQKEIIGEKYVNIIDHDNEGYIYTGTNSGIFRSQEAIVSAENYVDNLSNIELSIYPNPVVNLANIVLSLKKIEKVRLCLFSQDGRLVDKIAEGYFAAGIHNIQYINNLASGTYYIANTAGVDKVIYKVIIE